MVACLVKSGTPHAKLLRNLNGCLCKTKALKNNKLQLCLSLVFAVKNFSKTDSNLSKSAIKNHLIQLNSNLSLLYQYLWVI